MSNYINRLRNLSPKSRISGGKGAGRREDLPLDHQLTFSPEKDERWTFKDERSLCLNDEDVNELVNQNKGNIGLLCGISLGLSEYREFVWAKGGKGNARFNGEVLSVQDKVLGKLNHIYSGMTSGVRFELNGDNFWINDVNVTTLLKLYRLRPSEKARIYLIGLRDKLGLILSSRETSTRFYGAHEKAQELYVEISRATEYLTPDAPLCLPAGRRDS